MFKRLLKLIFVLLILIMLVPIVIVITKSFFYYGTFSLKGLSELFTSGNGYVGSIMQSMMISLATAIFTTLLALYLAFNFHEKRFPKMIILILGLLLIAPADIYSIGINLTMQYILHITRSTFGGLMFALISYSLPYSFVLIVSSLFLIDKNILLASRDLGSSEITTMLKIQIPLIIPTIISSFILSFLLSINEFSRTYFLGDSFDLLSTKINGQMLSGASEETYMVGLVNILFVISLAFILFKFLRKNDFFNRIIGMPSPK